MVISSVSLEGGRSPTGRETLLRKLPGGEVAQRTVWANLVIVFLPGFCLLPRGSQVFKHLTVHELVPDTAVETLGVSILPRTARFDIQCSHADLLQPVANRLGQELTAVVTAKVLRHAVSSEQLRQLVNYILAGDVPVHLQGQALPGILV